MTYPNSRLMDINISEFRPGKKAYFASDFHLGVPNDEISLQREKKIVSWLADIAADAQYLFLVGDLFDFWFEYKHVAPKGFVRLLGKLAELSDRGVEVIIFCGNHDLWFKDYLRKEIKAIIIDRPISITLGDKKIYMAHGDGLGPGGLRFKLIRSIFTNPLCQWLFYWIHPNIGYGLAKIWSSISKENPPEPNEDEKLLIHSKSIEKTYPHDFYIYGDCHLPKVQSISSRATYVNLGDWISHFTYGVFDGKDMTLKTFEDS